MNVETIFKPKYAFREFALIESFFSKFYNLGHLCTKHKMSTILVNA